MKRVYKTWKVNSYSSHLPARYLTLAQRLGDQQRFKRNILLRGTFPTLSLYGSRKKSLICRSASSSSESDKPSWPTDPVSLASLASARLGARLAEAASLLGQKGGQRMGSGPEWQGQGSSGSSGQYQLSSSPVEEDDEEAMWERWLEVFQSADDREQYHQALKIQLREAVAGENYADAAVLKGAVQACEEEDTVLSIVKEFKEALENEQYSDAAHLRDSGCAGLVGWWLGQSEPPEPGQPVVTHPGQTLPGVSAALQRSQQDYEDEIRQRIIAKMGNEKYDEVVMTPEFTGAQQYHHQTGHIIRITPECGRFVGRAFSPRMLAFLQESPGLDEDWYDAGVPVLEVFVERASPYEEEEHGKEGQTRFVIQPVALHSVLPPVEVMMASSSSSSPPPVGFGPSSSSSKVNSETNQVNPVSEREWLPSANGWIATEDILADGKLGGLDGEDAQDRLQAGDLEDLSLPGEGQIFYSEEMMRTRAALQIQGLHEFVFEYEGWEEEAEANPEEQQEDHRGSAESEGGGDPRQPGPSYGKEEGASTSSPLSAFQDGAEVLRRLWRQGDLSSPTASSTSRPASSTSPPASSNSSSSIAPSSSTFPTSSDSPPPPNTPPNTPPLDKEPLMPPWMEGAPFSHSSFSLNEDSLEDLINPLAQRTTFRRIDTSPPGPDVFSGLYVGQFGPHGPELVCLRRGVWGEEPAGDECVTAVKLSGDEHVPTGAASFRAKIGRSHRVPHHGMYPEELGVLAAYKGEGRVAELGFKEPKWVEGELLHLDGRSDGLGAGASVGFVWTVPGERRLLILFSRVVLPES